MQKKVTIVLGFMIFMFGFLKFFEPFQTWYAVQIQTSHLPESSYYAGILGEIFVGVILLFGNFIRNEKLKLQTVLVGLIGLSCILLVAIYVHLIPEVPSEVLPLKIKAPVIPALFLIATVQNLFFILKNNRHIFSTVLAR